MSRFLYIVLTIPVVLVAGLNGRAVSGGAPGAASRPAAAQETSWPVFRGDPGLSGVARGPLPSILTPRWTYQTGGDIKSTPVIAQGRVFVTSDDGKVYALSVADGKKEWEFEAGSGVEASPLWHAGSVFFGSLDGTFFALDASSGALRWKRATEGRLAGAANLIATGAGTGACVVVGSYDHRLYCFDAGSGTTVWTYATSNFINGAAAVEGGALVLGGCDASLHVLRASDGQRTAEIPGGSYIAGSPAIREGRAYVGHYGGMVLCVDLAGSAVAWEYGEEGGEAFFSSPAVTAERLVIGSRDRRVHAVRTADGRPLWTFPTRGQVDSSPVIGGDRVVAASSDGRLYILNLEDGKELARYEVGSPIWGSPAVAAGLIVVGAADGRVYAFGDRPAGTPPREQEVKP